MRTSRCVLELGVLVLVIRFYSVDSRALPQATVTQSGEPSHFQVDDKAAEIEVNANPAGVKINAKPASLQVVAKPGTPAIPVYHPAMHMAPHYLPPPMVHREPARYFLPRRHHCYPMCNYGMNSGWFDAGLRRNVLPKPDTARQKSGSGGVTGGKSSEVSRKLKRDSLRRELDEDGNVISRKHKSSIPRPENGRKETNSNKRQLIAGIPQLYMPQGTMGLESPRYAIANNQAPLTRNFVSPYNGGQSVYNPYVANGINSPYGQTLTNSPIGLEALPNYRQLSNGQRMYNGYGPIQPQFNSPSPPNAQSYSLGSSSSSNSNIINNFLQSELNHELYRSAVGTSPGLNQGYSRSLISSPYNGLLSGKGFNPYYAPLVTPRMSYQGGLLSGYGNSPTMQLAQLYAAMSQGLQQSRSSTLPLMSYPYVGGRSPLVSRSKVPGSKKKSSKVKHKRNSRKSKMRQKRSIVNSNTSTKIEKSRKKRQFLDQDLDSYNVNGLLQDALMNEFKRELILGSQSQQSQLPPITSQQSSLGLPLPGLPPVYDANQQQTANLLGLSQMAALDANYVAPFQSITSGNLGNTLAQSQALSSVALGRSQVSPDQLRLIPSIQQRAQAASRIPAPFQRQLAPAQQRFIQNGGASGLVGFPMNFREDYRSPIQYEDERRANYGRRHPLFRRRLHHNYYDDDYRDSYDDGYHDDREMYHGDHLGRETVSIGGPYSENEYPGSEGETLVDSSNHGFGPITVEAKTAEGLRKSLGEDRRGTIATPEEDRKLLTDEERKGRIAPSQDRNSLKMKGDDRMSKLQVEQRHIMEVKRVDTPTVEQMPLREGEKGTKSTLQEGQNSLEQVRRDEITDRGQQERKEYTEEHRRGNIDIPQREQDEHRNEAKKQALSFRSGIL